MIECYTQDRKNKMATLKVSLLKNVQATSGLVGYGTSSTKWLARQVAFSPGLGARPGQLPHFS